MRNPYEISQEQIRLVKLIKAAGQEIDTKLDIGQYEDCIRATNKILVELDRTDSFTVEEMVGIMRRVSSSGADLSREKLKAGIKKSADTFLSVKRPLDHSDILEILEAVLRLESYVIFLKLKKN